MEKQHSFTREELLKSGRGELYGPNNAQLPLPNMLMMDRIIFLGDAIYDGNANIIQAQLLFLQSTDAHRDIQLLGARVWSGHLARLLHPARRNGGMDRACHRTGVRRRAPYLSLGPARDARPAALPVGLK